jgi:hypothetical protein
MKKVNEAAKELPVGKALVAVEKNGKGASCRGCFFFGKKNCEILLPCADFHRKDKKNVIYVLVDYEGGTL